MKCPKCGNLLKVIDSDKYITYSCRCSNNLCTIRCRVDKQTQDLLELDLYYDVEHQTNDKNIFCTLLLEYQKGNGWLIVLKNNLSTKLIAHKNQIITVPDAWNLIRKCTKLLVFS